MEIGEPFPIHGNAFNAYKFLNPLIQEKIRRETGARGWTQDSHTLSNDKSQQVAVTESCNLQCVEC